MSINKKGLGKGLGALLANEKKLENLASDSSILEVDINKIEPNKDQPRKNFKQKSLEELAVSIKEFGIIQPLIVSKKDNYYKIIAGERRWRAARIAGLEKVPIIVRDYDELNILQVALIENIQRENLNPIEEAYCYKKLSDYFFLKREDIAKKVGKSRNTIGSTINLLSLDIRVQNLIIEEKLMIGQAKKLLLIKDKDIQFEFACKIIENDLSLKESEKIINNYISKSINNKNLRYTKEEILNFNKYDNIAEDLKHILGTNVNINAGRKKGIIEIEYYSEEDLDRLICIFNKITKEK